MSRYHGVQSKDAVRQEKVPLSLTMLSGILVQPLSAAGYANTGGVGISYYESFVGWEDPKNSSPSRIGPCFKRQGVDLMVPSNSLNHK